MAFIHERGQPDEAHTESTLRGGLRKNSTWRVNCIIQRSTSCNRTKQGQYFLFEGNQISRGEGEVEREREGERERKTYIHRAPTGPEHRFSILTTSHGLFFPPFSEVSFVSHFVPMCIAARGSAHGSAPFCYLDRCYNAAQHKRSLITADKWIKLAGGIELGSHL